MPDDTRRRAVLILEVAPGHVRMARGLVGRAIRRALGIRQWGTDPHLVVYYSSVAMEGEGGAPRFYLYATRAEFEILESVLDEMARAEGWSRPPVDAYPD